MHKSSTTETLFSIGRWPYHCEICGRSYSRRDHLARHNQTHISQRPFVCSECGKGFARRDLLLRHSAIHAGEYSGHRSPSGSQHPLSRRVTKACKACARAKVKCHEEKPCRRCLKRGIRCTPTSRESIPVNTFDEQLRDFNGNQTVLSPDLNCARDGICNDTDSPTVRTGPFPISAETEPRSPMHDALSDIAWLTSEPPHETLQRAGTAEDFPLHLTPDTELCLGPSFADSFLTDFEFGGGWERLITRGRIRQANEAYRASLWYSAPDQRSTRKDFIGRKPSSPLTDEEPETLMKGLRSSAPPRFKQSTRDNLFATLIINAHTQSPECLQDLCTAFLSHALLNTLLHSFFTKQDKKIDSWIHSATFEPNALNMELTAMIVAASSLNTSSPALQRLGMTLRRLLRPLILDKIEKGHEASCKLELYQAFLLSLELDLWHNEEDCLHRAGRLSSIIATFVREELSNRCPDSISPLLATDNVEKVTEKWIAWVRAESFKRLVARFCVYDNQLSMTLGVRALMSLSEYRPSVPQPKDLWLAKSHAEWSRIYIVQQHNYVPRVMDLFIPMPNILLITEFLDSDLAMKVSFHLIGGLITEYQLSTRPPYSMAHGPDSTQSRKRELETAIMDFHHVFSSHICARNIGPFIVSYLSMMLNAPIRNIEILSGKAGEQESNDMYQLMKDWPETAEAREAIWHAGQVLRLFKLLDRLKSFQIIMAYHAGIVLFAYSVLSCINGRIPATPIDSILHLNETSSSSHAEEFIRNGSCKPMLRSDFRGTERASISLLATEEAVEIISEVILNRSCNSEGLSPRLVNGLVKLLKDLASAIQIVECNNFVAGLEPGVA